MILWHEHKWVALLKYLEQMIFIYDTLSAVVAVCFIPHIYSTNSVEQSQVT
jgi:hypothetical protein